MFDTMKQMESVISVSLDVAENWKFSVFGIFLWILCTVHGTYKYRIQKILN